MSAIADSPIPLGSRLALAVLRQLARLPLSWLHRIGGAGGRLVYRCSARMRRRLLENVRESGILGVVDDATLHRFALSNAAELGKGALEILPAWFGRPEDIMGKVHLDPGSWERVRPLVESGRGVMFLTPHLGAFEVAAQFTASRVPVTIMHRPPRMKWLRPVVRFGRSRGHARLTTADIRGVRDLLRALRRGEAIGLLPDQVPAKHTGSVEAEFFGRPVHTTTLIARLQQATGVPIVLAHMRRLPGARGFELMLVPIDPLPHDDREAARILNALQEDLIRINPEQYLWSYNRFKAPMTPPKED